MRKILKIVLSLVLRVITLVNKNKLPKGVSIKNILVFQPGGIGDILRIFPAMESLRENFPTASISALVFPLAKEVFNLFPKKEAIAEIIDYDPEGIHKNLFKKIFLVSSLRRKKYDLTYIPARGRGTDGAILMAFFIGAPYRIGFAAEGVDFLNTVSIGFRKDVPIVKQNLFLLEAAGLKVSSEEIRLNVHKGKTDFLKDILVENLSYPLITIHPVATWNGRYRSWSFENYLVLIKKLVEELKANIVIIGSPAEREIGKRVIGEVKDSCAINLIGKTTIAEMATIIKFSTIFIGNDSGPLHLAESLGIPFIGIFGPTSPKQVLSRPLNSYKVILSSHLPCSPCYTHQSDFNPPCGGNTECLYGISISDVFESVKRLFVTLRKGDLLPCE